MDTNYGKAIDWRNANLARKSMPGQEDAIKKVGGSKHGEAKCHYLTKSLLKFTCLSVWLWILCITYIKASLLI